MRISVANGDLVEAVAVNPKEVLINGKAPGETSLIVWQQNGTRLMYDLTVRANSNKLEAVRQQIAKEVPDQDVTVTFENDTAFVRGTVKDVVSGERVIAIAGTLGKPVNLLRVTVPAADTQILLRVKFANVDRSVQTDFGVNLGSTAGNQITMTSTGQYAPLNYDANTGFLHTDPLNVFLVRPELKLIALIKALQARSLLEILAEPNLLAINGKQASFLAGGEFPFPMLQGGGATGSVTIAFKEFGIRINFVPTITPRGTIHLKVSPEVSSIDLAHGVTFSGYTIPALTTRRVQTEVELESGQTFVLAGLLDRRVTETLSRMPGLSDIPILGKLFQSKTVQRNNSELMIMITPEVVRPIPTDQPRPDLNYPRDFMAANSKDYPRTPGLDKTGQVPVQPPSETMPLEMLLEEKAGQAAPPPTVTQFQMVPVMPMAPSPNPGVTPAPMSSGGSSK
jgi:pilus assembly protein CpaC